MMKALLLSSWECCQYLVQIRPLLFCCNGPFWLHLHYFVAILAPLRHVFTNQPQQLPNS